MFDQLSSHDILDIITSAGAMASAIAAIAKAVTAFKKKSLANISSSKTIKVSAIILSGVLAYTLVDRGLIGHVTVVPISQPSDTPATKIDTVVVTDTVEVEPKPPVADTVVTLPPPKLTEPVDNHEYSVRIITAADNGTLRSRIESLLKSKKIQILKSREIDEERNKLLYFSQNSRTKAEHVADILNTELNLTEADMFVPKLLRSDQKQKVLQIYLRNQ